MPASYLRLDSKQWKSKLDGMETLERDCVICPRQCKISRSEKLGVCQAPEYLKISSANLHFGEEPPITGHGGSGTIFLTHCNLACIFCQNYPISQLGNGEAVTTEKLAETMLKLQHKGAHNINFVSPTHYTAPILRAIHRAMEIGLEIPIVWNSNGYESVETLRLLEEVVDIYLPDIKYSSNDQAKRLSRSPHYFETASAAVREMHRQVGVLKLDRDGVAERGLLIRHLVLPGDASGTRDVLRFIAEELSPKTGISLMAQYFPANKAPETPGMNRQITMEEYERALNWLEEFGLENGFTQESKFRFC